MVDCIDTQHGVGRLVLESMGEAVVAVDDRGRFILFNDAATRLLGGGPLDVPPEAWPERYGLFLPDGETPFPSRELALVRATHGESTREQVMFRRNERSSEGLFLGVTGMPLRRPGDGSVCGGVVVLRDITERIRVEERLERSNLLAELLKTVAMAANEAPEPGVAFQRALDAVCERLGCEVGFAFRARAGEAPRLVALRDGGDPRFAELVAATREPGAGAGLPGEVVRTCRASWPQETAGETRGALALHAGLVWAAAFPVLSGEQVVGVLEFRATHNVARTPELERALEQVGLQLGRTVERESARERERFFEAILDHVATPIFVKDRSFRWVFLNRAHDAMVGIPREQMLGKTDYDFFPKDQADFFRKKDIELFTRAERVEIGEEPITDASGETHLLATTKVPLFDREGELTHLVGIIHDITRLKQAEEHARRLAVETAARESAEQAHRRVALLADVSRVLARSIDAEATLPRVAELPLGTLGDWCVVLLGPDQGELFPAAVAHRDAKAARALEALLLRRPIDSDGRGGAAEVARSGAPSFHRGETTSLAALLRGASRSRSERPQVQSLFCLPLRTRERTLGVIAFAASPDAPALAPDDVALAEEVALRIALALEHTVLFRNAQEGIRVRDEFLQIASHELRTPLTSLKMQLQHAMRLRRATPAGPGDERFARAFKLMSRQVDRLSLLVANMLDVSVISGRGLALTRRRVDLVPVVREVLLQFSEESRRAGCRLRLEAEAPVVGEWDASRLQQVVVSLVSNALKFGSGAPVEVAVRADGPMAELTVTDRGIGIPPEDTARIFGQFERAVSARHFGGLGLGLFLARQIVEAHGGEVLVASSQGQGTTFTVKLPRWTAAVQPAQDDSLGNQHR